MSRSTTAMYIDEIQKVVNHTGEEATISITVKPHTKKDTVVQYKDEIVSLNEYERFGICIKQAYLKVAELS